MSMNEKINIMDDLEIEFRKMYNECKKKGVLPIIDLEDS